MTPTKYMINASDINKYKYITGGLWPPAASNFTELTFLPLLILVGVIVMLGYWGETKLTQLEFDKN